RPGDVFLKADQVVNCGILNEIKDSDDETALDERSIGAWNVLCEMIPGFKNRMLELSGDHSARKAICREIRAGMKKVRSDDTNLLKHGILSFMLLGAPTDQPSPALDGKTRHNHGWNHPQTARLLCPAKYDPTPENLEKLHKGELACTAFTFPRFLFPDNYVFDPEDILHLIFRGHILFRACRFIFNGPLTALLDPGSQQGESGNAAIAGLTEMTPRMIAYAAVQVRFALSLQSSWSISDGAFNYSDFFWVIVHLFGDTEDSKTHLANFNREVFGSPQGTHSPPEATPVQDEGSNDFELASRQRAKKRACHAAAAAHDVPVNEEENLLPL
ncbi:hypothetical protein H0H81_002055, partial [Sphagnurus paluster]